MNLTHSESVGDIGPALLEAQKAVQDPVKNKTNPHFGNSYADLNALLEAVRPVLHEQGILLVQSPGEANGQVTLDTMFLHTESGQWVRGHASSPMSKQDPQGVGSAITYLRRYSLSAMLGLGAEDDDGNAASKPESVGGGDDRPQVRKPDDPMTEKQKKMVWAKWLEAAEEVGLTESDRAPLLRKWMDERGVPDMTEVSKGEASAAIDALMEDGKNVREWMKANEDLPF